MSHPRLPRTFGSVLWLPLAHYTRHPFVLLAVTALPLIPGQLLGAYASLRRPFVRPSGVSPSGPGRGGTPEEPG